MYTVQLVSAGRRHDDNIGANNPFQAADREFLGGIFH